MDLNLLRCFTTAAEELHFGRASRRLNILPSALSRNIRLLEEKLGIRLFSRTTRSISLTKSGHIFLTEAKSILRHIEESVEKTRNGADAKDRVFRIGAMDSAATGLMPQLISDFREIESEIELTLVEDKTVNMLPKLISGALDVAFIRPPMMERPSLKIEFLMNETTFVALPANHDLAKKDTITVFDLQDVPLIVPSARHRPQSHKMTMGVFGRENLEPIIAQTADEKHTIVRLVGTGLGAALVPYWSSRITVDGVVYRSLVQKDGAEIRELPLAIAWGASNEDPVVSKLVKLVKRKLDTYLA